MTQDSQSPGGWDPGLLAPLAELNEQLLELLCGAELPAASGARAVGAWPLGNLAAELRALTPVMRSRLARCPYLLIDAAFGQSERWHGPLIRVMDAAPAGGQFASAEGRTLLRRSLLFAWHLAGSNRAMARITLGMSSDCAERIAQFRLRDLEWLAELSPPWIRPRWDDQPLHWQRLIAAARREPPLLLRQLQWHGLALLAARAGQAEGLLC